jgi:beta-N-acetylhexosaminidase
MDFTREAQELTIEELLGEAFMPRLEADAFIEDAEYAEDIKRSVREHRVGGFCIFAATPESTADSIEILQQVARESHGIPLLFSCDCEWGLPMRLRNGGTEFPDAMALGRSGAVEQTEAIGRAIAREMKALGMHWNFAPVADVNSNPKNPIINTRSFGEDPATVAEHVRAYVRGLQSEGVAASIKHFPGHGDTEVDSHKDLPRITASRERFDSLEFVPFRSGIESESMSIMLGHIAVPQLARSLGASEDELVLPATVSKPICNLIRQEWQYDGVLVTDGLEMHGLTKYFSNEEACLRAYASGLDVLLIPIDPDAAYKHLVKAAKDGVLSREHIERSAERVLKLKRWVHSNNEHDVPFVIDNFEHLELGHQAARRALEVRGSFPEEPFTGVVIFSDARPAATAKARYLADRVSVSTAVEILTPETVERDIRNEIGDRPLVVVLHRARGFIGGMSDNSTVPELIRRNRALLESTKSISVICFGSPYLDPLFQGLNIAAMVKTYSESTTSIDVVLERLEGLV